MSNDDRLRIRDARMDTEKVRTSIQRWPHSIECGIFRLETMPYIPFHSQCILDTTIMGWGRSLYRQSIDDWLGLVDGMTENKTEVWKLQEILSKIYTDLRLAIYL